MVYIYEFIICFKDDKEYLAYLKRIFYSNRFEEKRSKKKHQGDHGFSENSWNNPYTMLSNRGNYVFYFQELNGQKMLGDPFEDRMLKQYFFSIFLSLIFYSLYKSWFEEKV